MGLTINFAYDASVDSAPAGFKEALQQVADLFASMYADTITVTLHVGWGTLGSVAGGDYQTIPDNVAAGLPSGGANVTYAELRTALLAHESSADDMVALMHLGQADPTGGGLVHLTAAQCKALGFATSSTYDGEIGFGAGSTQYNFDVHDRGAGGWDFFGVAMHEISQALGRISDLSGPPGPGAVFSLFDLYRYAAPGVRELDAGDTAYFSIDGGDTSLATFDTLYDASDWDASAAGDCNSAFAASGVINDFSADDVRVLDVCGFTLTSLTCAQSIALHGLPLSNNWLNIIDTAAGISATLDGMQALYDAGSMACLTISDATTGYVAMTAAQFTASEAMLSEIMSDCNLSIRLSGHLAIALAANEVGLRLTGAGSATVTGNVRDNRFTANNAVAASFDGVTGNDTVAFSGHGSAVTASLVSHSGADAAGNAFSFVNIDNLAGSRFADWLAGDAAANVLFGAAGDDTIAGGGGTDRIYGQDGNDVLRAGNGTCHLDGGAGADRIEGVANQASIASYADAKAGVTVDLANTTTNTNDAAGDIYVDIHRVMGSRYGDVLVGDDAGVFLYGGGGADAITGGTGVDRLYGHAGNDTLTGGLGADQFRFARAGEGADFVTDFNAADGDRIDVSHAGFAGLAAGALDAARFVAGTTAVAATGQFIWDPATHRLYWDGDGTGAGTKVLVATLSGVSSLSAHDIFVL